MDILSLAWKNLWRNRRRTLITLLALSLTLMLVQGSHNLSVGVYAAMIDSGVRAGTGHLVIYRDGYLASRDEKLTFDPGGLPVEIAALNGVETVLPRLYLPGLAQSSRESRGVVVTGVDPALEVQVNPYLKSLSSQDLPEPGGRRALLGNRLMTELQLKPGQKFVVTLQGADRDLVSDMFRVQGEVRTGIKGIDNSLLLVGRERAAALAGGEGKVHELAVILNDQDLAGKMLPAIRTMLENRPDLRVYLWDEAMPNLANAIKLDYTSGQFIAIVLLLIVTIGVINTLLMSVMERFREFGAFLAVGCSVLRVRLLVYVEALLLGLVAALLGNLLGGLLTWYLHSVGLDLRVFMEGDLEYGGVIFDPIMRADWDLSYMLWMTVFIVILSLVAAFYPAFKTGRIEPAEALRHH